MILQSTQTTKGDLTIQYNQDRTVEQLQAGLSYKFNYWTVEENVKYYYFQAVRGRQNQKITLNVTAFTKDFYPTILVQKNVFNSLPDGPLVNSLTFPNMSLTNYTALLGDNFTQVAQQSDVSLSY